MFSSIPSSDWSRSIFFGVVPEHRSRSAVGTSDDGIHLVMQDCAKETGVTAHIQEHVVRFTPLQVYLQKLVGVSSLLFPGSCKSESFIFASIEMNDAAISLKSFPLAAIGWQIFPITNVDDQPTFDPFRKFTENWMTLDELLHPLLFLLKLHSFHFSLIPFAFHLLDEFQGKSSWQLRAATFVLNWEMSSSWMKDLKIPVFP